MGAFVVTGAGSGIGLAIARALIERDQFVFGLGRDSGKLERAKNLLGGDKFHYSPADLGQSQDSLNAIKNIKTWLKIGDKELLGLINNAGVFDRVAFAETSDQIWERQFQNNLMSAVRLTRALYPELKTAAPSSVLNISSSLGVRPIADTSAYSALKAAMVNWSKTLALEWAKDKIRVNCLCPGLVDTPIHGFHGGDDSSPERTMAHSVHPLGRMGKVADIADAAAFLLSEKSGWTTGSVMVVDGGISL